MLLRLHVVLFNAVAAICGTVRTLLCCNNMLYLTMQLRLKVVPYNAAAAKGCTVKYAASGCNIQFAATATEFTIQRGCG